VQAANIVVATSKLIARTRAFFLSAKDAKNAKESGKSSWTGALPWLSATLGLLKFLPFFASFAVTTRLA